MKVIIPYNGMYTEQKQQTQLHKVHLEKEIGTSERCSPQIGITTSSSQNKDDKNNTSSNECQPILIFQTAKKLYLENISAHETLDKNMVREIRCLLVDSDPTIAKDAIRVLIKLMERFGKQAADMILELGFAKLPLEGNFFIFAPPPFDVSLEFLAKFCRYHPQFFADNFTILKKYLESAFLTHEPVFMLLGFDIIDTMAEYSPQVLLEGKIREDLLKVLAVEKHNMSMADIKTKQEEQFFNSPWSIFFTMQDIHAEPITKHLFSRCLHSLIHLCNQLNKVEDPKVSEFFLAICKLLMKNPLKSVYPQLCLKLISVMADNIKLANTIGYKIVELSKNGLCHVDNEIRSECCALFLKMKHMDKDIEALELLIQGMDIHGVDDEILDVDLYKYLSPIKALDILADDPLTAMILMLLHILPNLFDMIRMFHHDKIQAKVLQLIVKIAAHTNVHANRFSKSGHLEEFLMIKLKIPKGDSELEISKLFGEGFVKILLKCSDPNGILAAFKRCRYVAGRSAIKFHIINYLTKVKSFTNIVRPEFIDELNLVNPIDKSAIDKWVNDVTRSAYCSQKDHEEEYKKFHNRFIRLKTPCTNDEIPLIKPIKEKVLSKAPKHNEPSKLLCSEPTCENQAGI